MNTVITILEIVAPVILLPLVGFVWIRMGYEYKVQFVSRLAMTIGVPALIFTALQDTEIAPEKLSVVTLAALTAYGVISVIAFAFVKLAKIDIRTYLAPLIFGNTGNLGMPLALFAFGDEGLGYAVVIFAASIVLSFTVGLWIVAGGGSFWKILKEPLVAATFLGVLFLMKGWHTPLFLTNTLDLLGQMAIPLMLITLGVAVARLSIGRIALPAVMTLVKFVFCVTIAWGIGRWFNLPPVAFGVLVLQISSPVAVTSYLLAEKYGADAEAVAGLTIISTLLAVVTLPLTLAFVI